MQRTKYNEKGEEVTEMVSEDEEPQRSVARVDKQVSFPYIRPTALLVEKAGIGNLCTASDCRILLVMPYRCLFPVQLPLWSCSFMPYLLACKSAAMQLKVFAIY